MQFVPFGSRLLVRPIEDKQTSNLILPDGVTKDRPQSGKIVSIGPDFGFNFSEGDTVYFSMFSPEPIEIDGEKLIILTEDQILGFLKN